MKSKLSIGILMLAGAAVMLFFSSLKSKNITVKDFEGAWGYGSPDKRTVLINSATAFAVATYDLPGKKFISTYGGRWRLEGNTIVRIIEWDSAKPENVGTEIKLPVQLSGESLSIKPTHEEFTRIDNGKPGELAGAWIINGRYNNDTFTRSAIVFQSRRTMKILSGTRFQWIAYDIDSKKFLNSGGGTYTTDNGKYTETIEFFTKGPEAVGRSLDFEYSFNQNDWRHRGKSSTGGVVDENWTKRENLEK